MLHGDSSVTGAQLTVKAASSSVADTVYLSSPDVSIRFVVSTDTDSEIVYLPITSDASDLVDVLSSATGKSKSNFSVAVEATAISRSFQVWP